MAALDHRINVELGLLWELYCEWNKTFISLQIIRKPTLHFGAARLTPVRRGRTRCRYASQSIETPARYARVVGHISTPLSLPAR